MPLSTKLSIGTAALLAAATLPTLTSAQSTCRWSYSSSCKTNPRSATYDVIFEVDEVSSNADIDGYPVTAIFHWGVENTTFTDTYRPGKQIKLSDTYYYDNNGYYTTGFSLIFGDGAAGCAGKTITDLDTLELGSGCAFGVDTPPPTPVPTTMETPEPTPVPTQNPITMFPTAKPTFEPSPQPTSPPTSPPTIMKPVATTTDATTTTTVAETTTTSTEASTTTAMITTTTIAPDITTTTATTTTSTVPATTSSTTTTETLSQKQIVPSSMTLYNVGELDSTALNKWRTKTIQQIITHSEDEDITVTLDNVSQVATGRRFLRQQQEEQQHSRILADDGYLKIDFDALVETESNGGLTEQDADDIVASGFSTAARQTEYIYLLKSADSATFGDIDRMIMVVDGTKVVTPAQKPDGGDGGGSNMGIIIGAAVGGVLAVFILIGSIFYTKRRKQLEPSKSGSPKSGSPLKDTKVMRDDVMGKEWSMQNAPESPDEEQTCASPYLGTIESREGEDDVSTLGDPYFGEAIDARDTGTVAESMVSSDMLALGVKRRGVGSSNASRMDATTATGYTTGLGSTYQMTFADDTTLDDAYQTPDAIGYEEEEDEDYERIVVVAPPGKLGIVIDNPSGNIPFVHAIKETSVLHGKVHVGDLVLAVDEVDCRGMHSMSVSRLISKRCDSARTLRLLRNSAC